MCLFPRELLEFLDCGQRLCLVSACKVNFRVVLQKRLKVDPGVRRTWSERRDSTDFGYLLAYTCVSSRYDDCPSSEARHLIRAPCWFTQKIGLAKGWQDALQYYHQIVAESTPENQHQVVEVSGLLVQKASNYNHNVACYVGRYTSSKTRI